MLFGKNNAAAAAAPNDDDDDDEIFYNAGSIPPDGVTQTLKASASDLGWTYEIDVKNCTTFLVYKLKPLRSCYEAYCFGNSCF